MLNKFVVVVVMAAHHYMLAAKKVPKLFLTYERIARHQKTVCLYVNAPSHPFPCDMCLIFVCLTVYACVCVYIEGVHIERETDRQTETEAETERQ